MESTEKSACNDHLGYDLDLAQPDDLHPGKLSECSACQWELARRAEARANLYERRADLLEGVGPDADALNLSRWPE